MRQTFINFTNHPSERWDEEQKMSALKYGDIVDLPFPNVDAAADEAQICDLAEEYVRKILEKEPCVVLCQGEFSLAYQVITRLKERGITVLAACSERNVKQYSEQGKDIKKEVIFQFRRFREY